MDNIAIVVLSVAVVFAIAAGFYAAGRRLSAWLHDRHAGRPISPVATPIEPVRPAHRCLAGVTGEEGECTPICDERPVRARVLIHSDEGSIDFVRRLFGAPNKLRAFEDPDGKHELCEIHYQFAMTETLLDIARHEAARLEFERNAEAKRQHFQRVGLARIMRSQIQAQTDRREPVARKRAVRKAADVIPMSRRAVSKAAGSSQRRVGGDA